MKKNEKNSSFKSFLKARNTKKGAISIAITVLVIVALVLLNVVTTTLTSRYSLYADMTYNNAYRLQDVTKQYASSVEKDVDFYVLSNETVFESYGDYYVLANKLIHQLCESSPHITLRYVDLTTDPTFPSAYPNVDWTARHVALVVCGDRYRVIDAEDMFDYELDNTTYTYVIVDQHIEQALATAVLTVTADSLTTVAVLTGQAELDMTPFTTLLKNNAYNVVTVDLSTGEIPAEAEFLIIYAPNVDIEEEMAAYLRDWLKNDGQYGRNLIYFPSDKQDVTAYPNLNTVIAEYGMSVDFGYLEEHDLSYIAATYGSSLCARFEYADEAFTKDLLYPAIPVYLYYTMPVNIDDSNLAHPILSSSATTTLHLLTADSDGDARSYAGAAVGTRSDGSTEDEHSSHVVVIGSYEAVNEEFLARKSYNNAAYFVNIFNTLSHNENIGVVIEGKKLNDTTLGADSAASVGFIGVLVRYVFPGLVLLAGLIIWLIRRHR